MILFLNYLSIFCLFFGGFFIFASFIGLIRYKDFYIKLHTLTMFNVYGASLILFSVSILSYEPIIFFEILFLIVINSICSIAITSFLLKNAILNDILYNAKSRDEIIQEENEEIYNKTRDFIDNRISKESLRRRLSNKDRKKLEKLKQKEEKEKEKLKQKEEKEKEKIRQKEEKEKLKQKEEKKTNLQKQEDKKVQQQSKEQQPQPQQQAKEQPKEQPKPKEEMTDIERENEELRQKIKEQKKILRKKIETVRKNAFITRKPEEIQKAEDLIKSILDKYHLTEEMLADDYEDDF